MSTLSSTLPVPPAGSPVLGVAALNRMARDILERALPLMWIRGEVSNFTCAASGHCYFTLKDGGAQVRCAMFRNRARLLNWQLQNGMQVEVRALVTLFEARGEFQLNVETVRRAGLGALYEAFERLKAKLAAEGLFDADRKRALPDHPRAIGVVTSTRAAALRDVLSVLRRRMPGIPVVVYPTPVQGEGAAASIAAAIETASSRAECDVLVLCRGGGSIEDLWAFNDERLARTIAACTIPVVSGVGHETDFTIADFVADLRAPTPSAAAEAVSPDGVALRARVREAGQRLRRAAVRSLEGRAQVLDFLGRRLVHPGERIRAEMRHLGHCAARLAAAVGSAVESRRWSLARVLHRLQRAAPAPAEQIAHLRHLSWRLSANQAQHAQAHASRLQSLEARLEALNPLAVLERGYAIVSRPAGDIVSAADELAAGEVLDVRFARGSARVAVSGTVPASDAAPASPERSGSERTR